MSSDFGFSTSGGDYTVPHLSAYERKPFHSKLCGCRTIYLRLRTKISARITAFMAMRSLL